MASGGGSAGALRFVAPRDTRRRNRLTLGPAQTVTSLQRGTASAHLTEAMLSIPALKQTGVAMPISHASLAIQRPALPCGHHSAAWESPNTHNGEPEPAR